MVGEIHLANIYFTDASASKVRPVLLLKVNSFHDILYLPLTSNAITKRVRIDSNDLENEFLPKTSIVVCEKPGIIAPDLLVKKIGAIHKNTFDKIIAELIQFIQK